MSIKIKAKLKADIITYFRYFVDRPFEQFSDGHSVDESTSQDAVYIGHAPVETIM